ncbi:hypothetical protein [Cellulomonas sp. RIT-PI-Y]|jgi:rhamnose utilization protein RhaD (predicted bifunctional aldolase and dehydrogenase)|uniref:hypothetical protein n=1 Tax=Cellulomonas sp. RIT-PI-Y TaxID=3035297 RepID=UPI0021DA280A|nr:hypothetical protein [Cellulomonas sp. RIT-PI-Y]
MSGLSISRSTGGSAAVTSGSPAQIAYDRAVKALAQAQQKLTQDGLGGAGEDQLKADQQAVELAQLAVQQAAARLAQEKKAAEPTRTPTTREPESTLDVLA